ncbi:MAG: histidine kinase, partial [Bacteroidota bacterium]
ANYYLKAIISGTEEGHMDVYEDVFDAAVHLMGVEIEEDGVVSGGKVIMSAISDAYLTTYEKIDTLNQKQIRLNDELNNLKLATEKRKRNKSLWLLGLLALGILSVVTIIYLWQRNKTIRQNFEIRLEALRSQINSHFISNTLNAIDLLIMEGNKNDASRYIVDLHRLVRMILDSSKRTLISLEREVDILKRYLKLEKLRLGERVQVKWDIAENIHLENHQVPPLILQPFVENAIWHGILNKDNNEAGTVQITMKDQGEMIECNIQDDGVGRKRASELKAEAALEFQSLGMKITNERIDALKKIKDASIETIDLYDDKGQSAGTKIVIRLPKLS